MDALQITNREQALAILARVKDIQETKEAEGNIVFGDPRFEAQFKFINDDSPLAAALCTRRAGKSYSAGLKLYKKAYEFPGSTVLYLALTRDSAKRIMWKDILKDIAKRYDIDIKTNSTALEVHLPNGSIIKLAGADASMKEREKFLGGKYPYVCVDEAGSFANELSDLIYEYLEPAVSDYNGSIDLIGTPTVFWQGFFCKVTEGEEKGWSIHKWNTSDNPFMKENWETRLKILKERNPRVEETPGYKRMYLGIWVRDLDNLIYKFQHDRNLIDKLPTTELAGQVLGMDLGFNDATAYALGQYYYHDENLYVAKTFKQDKQIIDDVVITIKDFINNHDIHTIVIDNASKQVVETLKVRFALYDVVIHAAEKRDKIEFIGIMNSDFIMGRIKLLKSETEDYVTELENLIKDPNKLKTTEHEACDNHICDAGLYMWRFARNFRAEPEEPEVSEEDQIEIDIEEEVQRKQYTTEEGEYYEEGSWGDF